jgi:hypothetical protein
MEIESHQSDCSERKMFDIATGAMNREAAEDAVQETLLGLASMPVGKCKAAALAHDLHKKSVFDNSGKKAKRESFEPHEGSQLCLEL